MDDIYQDYVNRLVSLTQPEGLWHQVRHVQPSPKFHQGQVLDFPGYTLITPPAAEDGINADCYAWLTDLQRRLVARLSADVFIPITAGGFHLTVADLLWSDRYQMVLGSNPQFKAQLVAAIEQSFQQYRELWSSLPRPLFQPIGLALFPRAITVALLPSREQDYEAIMNLRRTLYQNSSLIALGIEQQYNFTGHVTLGYFGEGVAQPDQGEALVGVINDLNELWLEQPPPPFTVSQVELRQFPNMNLYVKEDPQDPVLSY